MNSYYDEEDDTREMANLVGCRTTMIAGVVIIVAFVLLLICLV